MTLTSESSLLEILSDIGDVEVSLGRDMTRMSTMRLKAIGDLITVRSVDSLGQVLKKLSEHRIDYRVLGLGANQLLPKNSRIPYLKLDFPFDKSYFAKPREIYELPASLNLGLMTAHAVKFGLRGWEVFTGIPSSLGGAIFMNAGTNLGEIGELVQEVAYFTKEGKRKKHIVDQNSFSYRKNNFLQKGEVVYEVRMFHRGISEEVSQKIKGYLELRNRTQPLDKYTCGCIFKNKNGHKTCRAGQYIDIMGMKGFVNNDVKVSRVHANFMENIGDASLEDVTETVKMVKDELYLQFGISFDLEIKV